MNPTPIFFVFSFNRGVFLQNCVESIEACAPASEVVIFDDLSDDAETQRILENVATRHRVLTPTDLAGDKHGGLYDNMQSALESVSGDRLICFIQDDTQLVRALTEADGDYLAARFAADPDLGFITPAFIRGNLFHRNPSATFHFDETSALFFPADGRRSAGTHYSDLFIASSERLRAHDWTFQPREPANQTQAQIRFSKMGYLRCPFVMWLPNGTAYRGKRKTLAMRIAEHHRRCGFHPLAYMDPEAEQRLRNARPPELPVAERFLKPIDGPLGQPWFYNPLQGWNSLKHLDQAERALSRLLLRR